MSIHIQKDLPSISTPPLAATNNKKNRLDYKSTSLYKIIEKIFNNINKAIGHLKDKKVRRQTEKEYKTFLLANTYRENIKKSKIPQANLIQNLVKRECSHSSNMISEAILNLNKKNSEGLIKLSIYFEKKNNGEKASEEEIHELKEFLGRISGDKNLNHQLGKIINRKEGIESEYFDRKALEFIYEFTQKYNKRDDFDRAFNKLQNLNEKIKTKSFDDISQSQKLSLSELRILHSYTNFKTNLNDAIELLDNKEIDPLIKNIEKAEKILERISEKIRGDQNYQSGDLAFYDHDRWTDYIGHQLDRVARLQKTFVSDYSHVGMFVRNEDELHFSGMWSEYKNEEVELNELAVTQNYRLKFDKLLNENAKKWLYEIHKDDKDFNLNDYLLQRYQKISSSFHEDTDKFEHLINPNSARVLSALAPHSRSSPRKRGFDEIKFKNAKQMICSEFVVKVTLANLATLRKELSGEIAEFLVKSKGLSQEDAKVIADKNPVINFPVPLTEKLKYVNPKRAMQFLAPHMELIRPSKLLSSVIQLDPKQAPEVLKQNEKELEDQFISYLINRKLKNTETLDPQKLKEKINKLNAKYRGKIQDPKMRLEFEKFKSQKLPRLPKDPNKARRRFR